MPARPLDRVLIVGATSAIAHETARRLAADGARLMLAARDQQKLDAVAADLRARGARQVETFALDATHLDRHGPLLDATWDAFGGLDAALVAYGTLPDPEATRQQATEAVEAFRVNAVSVIALLTPLANRMEQQGHGVLCAISSVAGDRGRASNYVYGAAKAAVTTFLSGLRGRLDKAGVAVVTVKPGFVDTPMTAHIDKNPLFASPAAVGRRIHRAMRRGEDVVYAPAFWRPVMAGIRAVPERLFKRLPL